MKILHVLAQLPYGTGSGIYFRSLIDRFRERGVTQAALFAVQNGGEEPIFSGDIPVYPVGFRTAALPFPVPGMSDVMPYESTPYARMSEGMMEAWRAGFQTALEQAERAFRPDILLLHHLWMLTSLAVQGFPAAKKAAICHNTDLRQARQHPDLLARYVTGMDKLDRIFALSPRQKEEIEAVYGCDGGKITVVGGGYNDRLFFPGKPEAAPLDRPVRILYAGKIDPSKGVFELLRAYRRLRGETCRVTLDIVGAPNAQILPRFQEALAELEGVTVHPPMPQGELARFLRRGDLFVLPSFYEGLGLIALEALASGLWTVATEIEGLRATLGDRVNRSGVIEYVQPPRLRRVDEVAAEDREAFVHRLTDKLRLQIQKVLDHQPFPAPVLADIRRHGWGGVGDHILETLQDL